jgi:hypothetical protein
MGRRPLQARLRAEVLNVEDGDARKSLILRPRDLHDAVPLRFGIAEGADLDVNPSGAEGLVPVLGAGFAGIRICRSSD